MKHITEYDYEKGQAFKGFRVQIIKKGICFRKYVSCVKLGSDAARKKAIKLEAELAKELKKLSTIEELQSFHSKWK